MRIVLQEKDINFEIREFSADLDALNPDNASFMLVDRDLILHKAGIMMEYLDERFPHPPLMPVDPVGRAHNRQIRHSVMNDMYLLLDDFKKNNVAATSAKKVLRDHLTAIVPTLKRTEYFMSDEFTLVDCCMAPLLWRLSHYGIKLPGVVGGPLLEYAARLFERDAFQSSLSDTEQEYNQ